jgi:membrane-associated phospholipid phosphatase
MKSFLKHLAGENIFFLSLCVLFFALAGVLLLTQDKGDLVLFFSARRTRFLDLIFRYGTMLGEFLGYILVFVFLLAYRMRYALGTILLGLFSILSSWLLKQVFNAPRPLAFFRDLDRLGELTFVAGENVHDWFGFPSGHTLGAFALFSYLAFLLPAKRWTGPACFLLALMVGISRIYLVQHFLVDVYFGALFGLLLGAALYGAVQPWKGKKRLWLDQSLPTLAQRISKGN